MQLANKSQLKDKLAAMASGAHINLTEDRPVMHIALRAPRDKVLVVDGKDVVPEVHAVLDSINAFATKVRSGEWKVRGQLRSGVAVCVCMMAQLPTCLRDGTHNCSSP